MLPKHKRFFNILLDLAEEFEAEFGVNEGGSPVVKLLEQSGEDDEPDTEYHYDINLELDNLSEERG